MLRSCLVAQEPRCPTALPLSVRASQRPCGVASPPAQPGVTWSSSHGIRGFLLGQRCRAAALFIFQGMPSAPGRSGSSFLWLTSLTETCWRLIEASRVLPVLVQPAGERAVGVSLSSVHVQPPGSTPPRCEILAGSPPVLAAVRCRQARPIGQPGAQARPRSTKMWLEVSHWLQAAEGSAST